MTAPIRTIVARLLMVAALSGGVLTFVPGRAQAACPGTIPTTYGQATQNVTPGGSGTGTYRIWARLNGAASSNAMYLQINGQCFVMGGGGLSVGSWGWVDYVDGSTASKANVTLTGGTAYAVKLTGREAGLKVARLIFTTNTACVPSGDGAACMSDAAPAVSVSAPANGATVGGAAVTLAANASDDHGVASVDFRIDGVSVGSDTTSPYSLSWNSAAVANGTHTVAAVATDSAGQTATSSVSMTVNNAAGDTTAPSAPTLGAGTIGPGVVNLTWTAATDPVVAGRTTSGVASYRIFRGSSTTALGTVAAPATTYVDATVAQGTNYAYQVQAVDAAGNVGSKSNILSLATPSSSDRYAPPVPSGLRQLSVSTTSVAMAWTAVSDGTDPSAPGNQVTGTAGYKVYRGVALVATVTGQATVSFTDTGLAPGSSNSYTVVSYDNAGNVSNKSAAVTMSTGYVQDTTPPSTPGGLTVASKTQNSVKLTWGASADPTVAGQTTSGLAGYDIYRAGLKVGSSTAQSYTDAGLNAGSAYTYFVLARDGANNWSASSNSVTVTTSTAADTAAPSVPQNVLTSADIAAQADIFWDPSTDTGGSGLAGYNVYRDGVKINSAIVTDNLYSDSTVSGGKTYSYAVAAVDGAGNVSGKSPASSVTTPAALDTTPPSKPANLKAAATTINSVTLTWSPSTDNHAVLAYHVYRSGSKFPIDDVQGTSFTETDLNPGTMYSYYVSAYDADGNESSFSSVLNVTTKAVPAGFVTNNDGTTSLEEAPTLADTFDISDGTSNDLQDISSELTLSLPIDSNNTNANNIVKVEYYIDGELVATETKPPFTTKLNTAKFKNGKHEVKVVTTDSKGGVTESVKTITVSNGIWSKVLAVSGEQKTRIMIVAGALLLFLAFGIVRYILWRSNSSGPTLPRSNLGM